MRIMVTSLFVNDQEKALQFYTNTLGFVKKTDVPAGDYRWLTVVPPDDPDGVELLLEPLEHPAARAYQEAIFRDRIPATNFSVDDLATEHERLMQLGVHFTTPPTKAPWGHYAVIDDTCGNLLQLVQLST